MGDDVAIYLEIGTKRVFAVAVDWPGWARSGRTAEDALTALAAYSERYGPIVGVDLVGRPLTVVETVTGGAGTDFGVPSVIPEKDGNPLVGSELEHELAILREAWAAFDRAAAAAGPLRSGPRGGGRQVEAMVRHVAEAEEAYLRQLGSRPGADMLETRTRAVGALTARAEDRPIPEPTAPKRPWPARYFIRRSAWHALDHAWEIEDRAESVSGRSSP